MASTTDCYSDTGGTVPDRGSDRETGGDEGFSVVELMIGVVLIVVGLVGIMSSSIRLAGLQRLDAEIGYAYAACRTNLEELRAVPVTVLPILDGRGFDVPGIDGSTPILRSIPGDPDGLPGEIRVTLDRGVAGRRLYRVETAVTWTGASGRHDFKLATLIAGAP